MIVLRTPKGWTGPKEVDGLPVEGTWRSHQVPLADARDNAEHLRHARGVAARATGPRSSSTTTARSCRSCSRCAPRGRAAHEREPARERRPLLRDLVLPDFRDYAVEVHAPGTTLSEATRVLGGFLRDVIARNRGQLPPLRPRRDGVEPPRRRLRGDRPRAGRPRSCRPTRTSPRDGRVIEVLSEHLCQGWLEGYLLTGQARALQLLRGLHPHRRLDVQPAREVAEGDARDPVAAADRLAQLPAQLARLAAGPQRLLAPGSGLHRPRREQEGRDHPRLPAARREHACSRSPTTACAAATT